jgi:hypothetical protein
MGFCLLVSLENPRRHINGEQLMFGQNALNSQSSLGARQKNRTETVQVAAPPNLQKILLAAQMQLVLA